MARQRDQWIFVWPCDCPFGVMEGYLASDEQGAFDEMFEGMPQAQANARDAGLTTRLIPWQEYDNRYFPKMTKQCEQDLARTR
jgi:hypothetical protein